MPLRARHLALLLLIAAAGGAEAADPQLLNIPFHPRPADSFAYRIKETAQLSWNGTDSPPTSWSQRFDVTFGTTTTSGGMTATVMISDVKTEEGKVDSLRFLLAEAAEGEKINVIFDARGFVREVGNWAALRDDMKAKIATLTDADTAKSANAVLDRLDSVGASTAIARTFLLVSGAYAGLFATDKSVGTLADWRAGSAYVIAGRSAATKVNNVDGEKALIDVGWTLNTDRQGVARVVGPEILGFIASTGNDPALADARAQLRAAIAGNSMDLAERAEGVFDLTTGLPRSFHHELTTTAGTYRSQQTVDMTLIEE